MFCTTNIPRGILGARPVDNLCRWKTEEEPHNDVRQTVQDELRPQTRELRRMIPGLKGAALHGAAFADGVLDAKTKELIALAISVNTQCDGCISSHARAAARTVRLWKRPRKPLVSRCSWAAVRPRSTPPAYSAFQEFYAVSPPRGAVALGCG